VLGYNGGERKRTNAMFGGPGMRFLPIRYTPLDVVTPSPGRRHLIEWFDWHRTNPDGTGWSLGWMLDEIVADEMFPVAGEGALTTSEAATPPMSIDVSRFVQVRVNAAGEAEWVMADPAHSRSGVIGPRTPR